MRQSEYRFYLENKEGYNTLQRTIKKNRVVNL